MSNFTSSSSHLSRYSLPSLEMLLGVEGLVDELVKVFSVWVLEGPANVLKVVVSGWVLHRLVNELDKVLSGWVLEGTPNALKLVFSLGVLNRLLKVLAKVFSVLALAVTNTPNK